MLLTQIDKIPTRYELLKDPAILNLESLSYSKFHLISLVIFLLAIIHTFSVRFIHQYATNLKKKHAATGKDEITFVIQLLFFLAEVEVVFAIWAIPLFITIACMYDWNIALEYFHTRDYTEPLFVVIILALASTKPIIHMSEKILHGISKIFGGSVSATWFTLLTIGPLMGSFITEVAAMIICALLLSNKFYAHHPSSALSYATIGLLFVNISVGGILTDFASPAVLILSHSWKWNMLEVFMDFGYKAIIGIVIANTIYWLYFRKELKLLSAREKAKQIYTLFSSQRKEETIPYWITLVHVLFLVWIVVVAHYPIIFIASFLFFIGFHQATKKYQYEINMTRPLLVGLFLGALTIHGGVQGWWVVSILKDLSPLDVFGVSIALTAFNDNVAIAYLATLVPDWNEIYQYMVFTGLVAGGGLTVIANAPNPAGYSILKKHFPHGLKPFSLLLGALVPTMILYVLFYFLRPSS
jgi:hypothetical protein